MEINGIAHVNLTVTDMGRSRPFYRQMLTFLGLKPVIDGEAMLYCVGGRTAMGIQACEDAYKSERFVQRRTGLHHVCFRAREREDVDRFYEFLKGLDGAKIVHPPEEDKWAPGYYSVLFEDPDGIRLEMNHVPGRGLLEQGTRFGQG